MTLEDIVSGYSNVLISLADPTAKRCITPGAPDIREFARDAIPDKDARVARCISFPADDYKCQGHGHGHMEHSNWRMIDFSVGPFVEQANRFIRSHRALNRFFIFITLNDLMNKLIMTASVISILIVFIVLLAVHKGHAPIRSVSRQIQDLASKDLERSPDPQTVPVGWNSWYVVQPYDRAY